MKRLRAIRRIRQVDGENRGVMSIGTSREVQGLNRRLEEDGIGKQEKRRDLVIEVWSKVHFGRGRPGK